MSGLTISRRRFMAAAGVSAIGATMAPGLVIGAEGNVVSLQLNWIPAVDFAGFYIADTLGYYKDEGVEIKFLPGGPNMQAVEQVIAGGTGTAGVPTFLTSTVNAVGRGTKLTVIGAVFQTSPLALMSLEETPLRNAQDLVGKRIGAAQGRQRELNAVFKINNLDPNSYKFTPIGFDPTPLVKKDVDVVSVFATSEPLILAAQGIKTNVLFYADIGLPTYTCPIVVDSNAIANNRKTIVSFLRASIKGWEKNAQDTTIAPKLVVEKYATSTNRPLDHHQRVNDKMMPLTQSDLTREKGMLWIDKKRIAGPIYAGLSAAGDTNLPAVDSYVDTSLLEEAFGKKNRLL